MLHFPQISNYIPSVNKIEVKKIALCAVSLVALAVLIAPSTAIMAGGCYEDYISGNEIADRCLDLCQKVVLFQEDRWNSFRLSQCILQCWESFAVRN